MTSLVLAFWLTLLAAAQGNAQETVWMQIDAQPNEAEAEESARYYESFIPDVAGFELDSGWYVVALGPYTPEDAANLLQFYQDSGQIPSDSFTSFAKDYQRQFWPRTEALIEPPSNAISAPNDGQADSLSNESSESITVTVLPTELFSELPSAPTVPAVMAIDPPTPELKPTSPKKNDTSAPAPSETGETGDSENTSDLAGPLNPASDSVFPEPVIPKKENSRQILQRALTWSKFYTGEIDGDLGPKSRAAIRAWQTANGNEATGIMTKRQRARLTSEYALTLVNIDLQQIRDDRAGIAIMLPMTQLGPPQYSYPFVRYAHQGNQNSGVLLISQAGDRTTLSSLYKVLQTLQSIPLGGARKLNRGSFVISSENDIIFSHTEATLGNGAIKGFTLAWPREDGSGYEAILAAMQASFTPIGGVLKPLDSAQKTLDRDLLSGFEIRRPKHSKSGIFVTESGVLITTAKAVEGCRAITIDRDFTAEVTAIDTDLGVALVTPTEALSPISVGRFSKLPARRRQQIVTAGYSFEGVLETSSLTNGVITDTKGLFDESDQLRLALPALSGDAGGPVLGSTAAVLGMLKDRKTGARTLPDDVSFAITSAALVDLLKRNGITARTTGTLAGLSTGQRAKTGRDITAMVSCWE